MKIEGVPGTYYAQAFLLKDGAEYLCGCFHESREYAVNVHGIYIIWPVEMMDGIAYIPSEEELKEFENED